MGHESGMFGMDMHANEPAFIVTAILRTTVILLSRLNECFACFNPWLIAPAVQPDGQVRCRFRLLLSLVYAIPEPVLTQAILWSGIPPWIVVLAVSPASLHFSKLSLMIYRWTMLGHELVGLGL